MLSTAWKRAGAIAAVGAALAASVVVAAAADATAPKTYTATAAPTKLTTAAGQTVSITLTNTTRAKVAFAAANLAVPAGLAIDASVAPTLWPKRGTASVHGSTLKLRNLAVGAFSPYNKVTVTFVLAAVPPDCAAYEWASDVRQSNDFNGTRNTFDLVGPPATMEGPCSAATVACDAGDGVACATGTITSPAGSTAEIVVQDGDTLDAVLTASYIDDVYDCAEYTTWSDQLLFGIDVLNGVPTETMTKSVAFSRPVPDPRPAWEYQVCFKAPYDFPALLPSELAQDFIVGDFSGNTQPEGAEFKGLLLPCTAGYGVPCVLERAIVGGRIEITISTAVADPAVRF